MGTTKLQNGDGHIIFHVGKELPPEGSNFILVPGRQNAQGRGVYFADQPRLKYSGGEYFREKPARAPIFCIPMVGKWVRAKKHKKFNREVSYHSNQKVIVLFGLRFFDGEIDGQPVRYYYPQGISFFREPDIKKSGSYTISAFSEDILQGRLDFNKALERLQKISFPQEEKIEEEYILERLEEAIKHRRLPGNKVIERRLNELRILREGVGKIEKIF